MYFYGLPVGYQFASGGYSEDHQGDSSDSMCSVPSFWEKVYSGVQEKINETTGLKKKLMLDALK